MVHIKSCLYFQSEYSEQKKRCIHISGTLLPVWKLRGVILNSIRGYGMFPQKMVKCQETCGKIMKVLDRRNLCYIRIEKFKEV